MLVTLWTKIQKEPRLESQKTFVMLFVVFLKILLTTLITVLFHTLSYYFVNNGRKHWKHTRFSSHF